LRLFYSNGVYDIERGLGDLTVPHSKLAKVRWLAIAVLGFVAVGGGSAWFINKYFGIEAQGLSARLWPAPTAQQVEVRQLRKIAGWFSLDCGHVRYRENADRAIACAQDALRARRRFYIAFDFKDFDSHGTTGLAANSEGAVYEVVTEQLTGGWGGYVRNDGRVQKPTIVLCQKAPFERTSYPANRFLSCLAESTPE
jgi:hypothetical protein